MWHRKHLHGCWQWCHLAAQQCCTVRSWEAPRESTGTCSSHSVSAAGWVQSRAWGRSVDRLHRLMLPDKGICSCDRELLFFHYLWRALQRSISLLFLSCPPPLAAPGIPASWTFSLPHMAHQHSVLSSLRLAGSLGSRSAGTGLSSTAWRDRTFCCLNEAKLRGTKPSSQTCTSRDLFWGLKYSTVMIRDVQKIALESHTELQLGGTEVLNAACLPQ